MTQATTEQSIVPLDDSGNPAGPPVVRSQSTRLTLRDALETRKSAMASVATKFLSPDKLVKIVCGQMLRVPALADCTIESVLSATMICAELGLAPGILGSAYFIPYGKTCQLIVGYRGMIELARRSGTITTIQSQVVREGDEWAFSYTTEGAKFTHVPKAPTDAKILGCWALATFRDGGHQFDYMSREEVDGIRRRSRASGNGPWVTDYAEMAKKTVLRRLCKLLPLTPDVTEKISLADSTEFDLNEMDSIRPAPGEAKPAPTPDAKASTIAAKIEERRAQVNGNTTGGAPADAASPAHTTSQGEAGNAPATDAKPTTAAEAAEFAGFQLGQPEPVAGPTNRPATRGKK